MNRRVVYTIMLASSLIVLHFTGHYVYEGSSGLSDFPDLVLLLPLPVILFVFLRPMVQGEEFTLRKGVRAGEFVVRRAAFPFAFFVAAHGYFVFTYPSMPLVAISFFMALLGTWIAGIVCSAICTWIIERRASGAVIRGSAA